MPRLPALTRGYFALPKGMDFDCYAVLVNEYGMQEDEVLPLVVAMKGVGDELRVTYSRPIRFYPMFEGRYSIRLRDQRYGKLLMYVEPVYVSAGCCLEIIGE